MVPTENLEDVRRNITEAKRAEAESMEFSSPENQSLFEGDANQYTPEVQDNNSTNAFHAVGSLSTVTRNHG